MTRTKPAAKDITAQVAKVTKATLDKIERDLANAPTTKRKPLTGMPFGVAMALSDRRRRQGNADLWVDRSARAARAVRQLCESGVEPIDVNVREGFLANPGIHVEIQVADVRAARLLVFDAEAMPALEQREHTFGFRLLGCWIFEPGARA